MIPQSIYVKYRKALKDYEKIENANSFQEKVNKIIEAGDGDDRMVIQNFELLVSKTPCDKWLWKTYLEFLMIRQPRVCLFFFKCAF